MKMAIDVSRRWRISIRQMLLLVAILSVLLAWYQSPRRRTKALLEELANHPSLTKNFAPFARDPSIVKSELRSIGHAAVPYLIEALQADNVKVRYIAAGELGRLKDLRAVDHLINSLMSDQDESVRCWSAKALGEIGDSRALPPLKLHVNSHGDELNKCIQKAIDKIMTKNATTKPETRFMTVRLVWCTSTNDG